MLFYITNKLQKKLHVPLMTPFPVNDEGYRCWYANVFYANRIQYILTTHATSRYSVVMYGKGINTDGKYISTFTNRLKEQLQWHGLEDVYRRYIEPYASTATFAKTTNRSVLSFMSKMAERNTGTLEFTNPSLSPLELGVIISEVPVKSMNYRLPVENFAMLLCKKFTT